jgi:hypothetical protein
MFWSVDFTKARISQIQDLRLKDNLLAVIKGEGETSQDTLANQGLVT